MAKAKAKAVPKQEVSDITEEPITEDEVKEPTSSVSKASNTEKKESFTAAFKNDAHAAVDHFLKHNSDNSEEISREESDAGDEGVRVTVTYK